MLHDQCWRFCCHTNWEFQVCPNQQMIEHVDHWSCCDLGWGLIGCADSPRMSMERNRGNSERDPVALVLCLKMNSNFLKFWDYSNFHFFFKLICSFPKFLFFFKIVLFRNIKIRFFNLPIELSELSSTTARLLLCIVRCWTTRPKKTKPCNLGKLLCRNFR